MREQVVGRRGHHRGHRFRARVAAERVDRLPFTGAEFVVGDDGVARHADGVEQERDDEAGAILAARAVDHLRRAIRRDDVLQRAGELGLVHERHATVVGAHDLGGFRRVDPSHVQRVEQVVGAARQKAVVDQRRRILGGHPVGRALAFFRIAQIENAAQAQRRHLREIGLGEARQAVGPEQHAEAGGAGGGGQAAQVAHVLGAFEAQDTV